MEVEGVVTLSSPARRAAPANTRKRSKSHVCAHRGCGKAFEWPSGLKLHARVHTGESIANAWTLKPSMPHRAPLACARAHS